MIRVKSLFRTIIATSALLSTMVVSFAAPPGTGWTKVFSDEFNDYTVDSSKWRVLNEQDWNANGEKSWHYPSNVKENGNALIIENNWSNGGANGEVYSGGWIDSKQQWNKGYFEARVRLDWADNHFWPTFWMWKWQANRIANEFDIMEYTHWGTHPSQTHHYSDKWGKTSRFSSTRVNEWHVWGVLWTDTEVTFYIDGVKQFSSDVPESAKTEWLPMIFSCSPNKDNRPNRSGSYPRFFVDWVRVWQGGNPHAGGSSAPINAFVALKANGNGKYVCSDRSLNSSTWPLAANRTSAGGTWEKFTVVSAGGDFVALKAHGNNKYVSADQNLGGNLVANRTSIGLWEKFTWHPQPDGTVALKAAANNKYVSSDRYLNATHWPLSANRNSVGAWEKFRWERK